MQLKQIPSMHTSFVYMSIITLQVLLRCYTTRLHYGKYFICLPKRKKKTMLILNHILEVLFKQIKEICVYFLLIFYLCSSTK